MTRRVLFVDDEPNVLAGFERQFRKRNAVETALGGAAGLAALAARGPFAVVVSDLRMPGMDGVQFLARVRAEYPDAVRVLLTGYADVRQAVEAVNQGGIFRFLTKPCPHDGLTEAVDAAVEQHRLVTAERELLDKTLRGSVQVLGEVLALANPAAFGQVARVQQLVRDLGGLIPGAGNWEVEVAAVLSRLGCVAIPEAVLAAADRGGRLSPEDQRQLDALPAVTRNLLRPIPRLERVTEILEHLDAPFDGGAAPPARFGKAIPLGARVLRVAFAFDALVARGVPKQNAAAQLRARAGWYDPDVLAALEAVLLGQAGSETREVTVGELARGMVLAEDVYSDAGVLLLSRGHPITEPLKHPLATLAGASQTPWRLRVYVPASG